MLLLLAIPATWRAIATFSPELSIDLTQDQLQNQLNAKFPAEKCILGACLELRDPCLRLDEGSDRVSFNAQFVATLGKRKLALRSVRRLGGKVLGICLHPPA